MLDFFQYDFLWRGLAAGIAIAIVAPLIGIFLILRRYALIADTLSHVSLAGIALGLLLGVNPLFAAIGVSVASSIAIDRLRTTKIVSGETALSLFLSGSLAVAVILIRLGRGPSANLWAYLFGSIVTVRPADLATIAVFGSIILIAFFLFYKELFFISFDEDTARVSGLPVRLLNLGLVALSAVAVALAIPIVGVLLVSALIVIPVAAALQLKKSFFQTVLIAELMSLSSVIAGLMVSFYLDLAPGATIVLLLLAIFSLTVISKRVTRHRTHAR